ncbi:hypothetical protein [Limnohabitans sp.]|uniref:hypothetical protein n=1 Tax=Limnohabitans sp. TaxID=1907725 RepID=UPI0037C072C3
MAAVPNSTMALEGVSPPPPQALKSNAVAVQKPKRLKFFIEVALKVEQMTAAAFRPYWMA